MIRPRELRTYGSAVMPTDDTTANVGGAIDLSVAVDFLDLTVAGRLQVVSSDPTDTALVNVSGRQGSGVLATETVTLNGIVPVPTVEVAWNRIMMAQKLASTSGVVAVESVTATATGTLVAVSGDIVQLAANSSNVDLFYSGMILRVTGGTGAGFIARILDYNGLTQEAVLDADASALDATSVYRLGVGITFWKSPHEIMTVRRPFFNAVAAIPSGSTKIFYEKFFWRNNSIQTLSSALVKEGTNPTGRVKFALESSYGSATTTANRLTAPDSSLLLSFDRVDVSVPSGQIGSGQALAVWLQFTVPAGQAATNSFYSSKLQGQTS